jgi:alcohol dehydrogenase class IV
VVAAREAHFKASLRSVHLIPRIALVDPALTDSVPLAVTASTGLDALTQLIEPYLSNRATPMTDALSLQGIQLAARALPRVCAALDDRAARDDMALAALLGGMCLANAGLGAVHGFAAPLGASYPIPHGVACAAMLPYVMRANVDRLRAQAPAGSTALAKYARVGEVLAGPADSQDAAIEAAIRWVSELVRALAIPRLGTFGVQQDHLADLAARAKRASSMRYNPIELPHEVLVAVLEQAL